MGLLFTKNLRIDDLRYFTPQRPRRPLLRSDQLQSGRPHRSSFLGRPGQSTAYLLVAVAVLFSIHFNVIRNGL